MSRSVNINVKSPTAARRALRYSSLVWLVGIGACTSVLGIEDLHDGPRPGSGGDGSGATDNTGGTSTTAGKSNAGGKTNTGGSSNPGGTDNSSAGIGNEPSGGDTGIAGIGNDAGAGGAGPASSAVHGHVIDFWGHGVPNIPVQIGDTLGSTDDKGDFVFDSVPATYDVSMVYDHPNFPAQSDAWVYQGLTRRDPTLQMYAGAAKRSGNVDINFVPKPTLAANQTIWVDIGGVDGATLYYDIGVDGYQGTYAEWFGPATAQQTAHGLMWQKNAASLPTSYLAYDSTLVALAETGTSKVTLDLTKSTIDTGTIQGTVTPSGAGSRENEVFLRFTSNATIQLVDDNGPSSFSYVVPSIPNSNLTVAAEQGSQYEGWAVAHADGLAPGAKPVLKVPGLVTLLSPAGAATNITEATKFTFQSPAGNTGPFVVEFYSQDDVKAYQTIYVVTSQKQITIPPIIGGGFSMYPGGEYIWGVATHGNYASVDALASKEGFLDEFSRDEDTADGPRKVTGEFTDSVPRGFTLKP
jgi:hypothetical protein